MPLHCGYCTNVHAGANLEQTRANLERYALAVKRRFSPDAPMGVGLWLAASAARKLVAERRVGEFAAWLAEVGLLPFTLNGFPFGDFHLPVVKHRVYEPTWFEPARAEYTRDLIAILHDLLPAGMAGSISTLPIAWGRPGPSAEQLRAAAVALRGIAGDLARLERETGRLICLCLEPEPGCVLQYSTDVVRFFEDHLLHGPDEAAVRRYLRVCHDVCHAAVMFEEQADVLRRYRTVGLGVGKIQVSSAIAVVLDRAPAAERGAALDQLAGFAEDRYLHQTMARPAAGESPVFYDDLPAALRGANRQGEWRVHFHVPIYLQRFGRVDALQGAIRECLRVAAAEDTTDHFEVETYAWGVLPPELRQPDLAAGISDELVWFRRTWAEISGGLPTN
jgi:hypothetical protein